MEEIKHNFCLYLKKCQKEIVADWKKKIIVRESDPYADQIIKNGENILSFFIQYLKEESTSEDIKVISKKISQERAEAKVNIGDFIYNTNIAKKQMMDIAFSLNPNIKEYQWTTDKVNSFFDSLIYYTIYSYYE